MREASGGRFHRWSFSPEMFPRYEELLSRQLKSVMTQKSIAIRDNELAVEPLKISPNRTSMILIVVNGQARAGWVRGFAGFAEWKMWRGGGEKALEGQLRRRVNSSIAQDHDQPEADDPPRQSERRSGTGGSSIYSSCLENPCGGSETRRGAASESSFRIDASAARPSLPPSPFFMGRRSKKPREPGRRARAAGAAVGAGMACPRVNNAIQLPSRRV